MSTRVITAGFCYLYCCRLGEIIPTCSLKLGPKRFCKQLSERLFPSSTSKPVYKMPDYASVHKELQRSGVTLNLLWLEYCDQCRAAGEIPYQSTPFNKYYADYLAKVKATMHLNHKPGEVMQVDWAGDTAAVIDTDTGKIIPAYVFVATLPYSGYSYVEAFFSMNQESWTTAHVNAYKYFGGATRIIQCDNLKTGVQKHGKDEVVLNKSYEKDLIAVAERLNKIMEDIDNVSEES